MNDVVRLSGSIDAMLAVVEHDLRERRLRKWPDEEAAPHDGGFLNPAAVEVEEP